MIGSRSCSSADAVTKKRRIFGGAGQFVINQLSTANLATMPFPPSYVTCMVVRSCLDAAYHLAFGEAEREINPLFAG
jgi:hypothetical protein